MTPLTNAERALCWRFFSELMRGNFTGQVLSLWPAVSGALLEQPGEAVTAESLQKLWARLFYGVGEKTVPLSQSSWENTMRLTNQASALSALESYRAAGVAAQTGDDALPPDHLAVMAGFMAHAIEKGIPVKVFFRDHFGSWIESFVQSAEERSGSENEAAFFAAFMAFVCSERVSFAS